jgi:threonine dehydrogenase-like Zn-dependent dehydrogenase
MVPDLIAGGRIDVKPMIPHRFPSADIGRGFETMRDEKDVGAVFVAVHI